MHKLYCKMQQDCEGSGLALAVMPLQFVTRNWLTTIHTKHHPVKTTCDGWEV